MSTDADTLRAEMLERWERVAPGWGRHADAMREQRMPSSIWMVEQLGLQPGQTVLELAAGTGDTGFLAAELVKPGGRLISSDASNAMLEVARARAEHQGIDNAEFRRLELEWIDLETATVDAILCRWGVMLCVDPAAALHEMRRVLRPGGRIAVAAWDLPERNPWMTTPGRALMKLGLMAPPDPSAPGPFRMSEPGLLQRMLEDAGFVEVLVESVELPHRFANLDQYVEEQLAMSAMFSGEYEKLNERERAAVRSEIESLTAPFRGDDGTLRLPGRTLCAAASS
jgi:ubiquinone/menaquinone biosynthesis C-methylase UbiE